MSTKYNERLPDFLAGFLSESESKEIEQALYTEKKLKEELTAIEVSLENYAHATAGSTPVDLSEEIWKAINSESHASADVAEIDLKPQLAPLGGFLRSYMGIAASVLLLASLLGNLYLAKQATYQKNNFLSTLEEKNRLQERLNEMKISNELTTQEVSMLKNPDMKVCKLISPNLNQPASLLLVIDTKKSMQVMVMSPDLPEKPLGHSYQLWAVSSTGEMICMGTFDSEKKIYEMKHLPFEPKEFGVTMEEGELGKPQPTSKFLVRGI